ncbi:MAG: NosD domain-containing protein [archaeon]
MEMKKLVFAFALALSALLFAPAYSACVNPLDNSTFAGKIESLGTTSFWLTSNVTLCTGRYELGSRSFILSSGHTGITLDCNGSTIVGPGKIGGASGGVLFGCFSGNTYFTCTLNSAVRNCVFEEQNTAISATNVNSITIENNTIRNVNYGISVSGSKNPVIRDNSISGAIFDGISIREGIGSWKTIGADVSGNLVSGSGHYGLNMLFVNSSTFAGNRITGNGYGGIYALFTNANTFYNNHFENSKNVRLSNSTDFWNIQKTAGTNIIGGPYLGGNYWSNYNGTDSDGDGLGDSSHSEKLLGTDKGLELSDNLPLARVPTCFAKEVSSQFGVGTGFQIPAALPYKNEIFNVKLWANQTPAGSFVVSGGAVSSISCSQEQKPTYTVYVTRPEAVGEVANSADPLAELNQKISLKEIDIRGETLPKKIGAFFTKVGLKVANFVRSFGKRRK